MTEEEARAFRNLYDAVMDARPYVAAEAVLQNTGLGHTYWNRAPSLLERLDAALVDAGELLRPEVQA